MPNLTPIYLSTYSPARYVLMLRLSSTVRSLSTVAPIRRERSFWRTACWLFVAFIGLASVNSRQVHAEGEPAAVFIKQLRAAGYYDLAIGYLERLDQYPGVDSAFMTSVPLEKAQTYIDSAIAARSADQRNELFQDAEEQLQTFLKNHPENPRASEARAQLGKLRMFRASQFMTGEVDEDKRRKARELYQAAADTFDAIIEDLKKKIAELQGAKIDAKKEPEKAALRDSYYGEFMMAKHNAGESRLMAAETFVDPAKDGKKQLEEALAIYTDLSQRYGKYVQGLSAFYTRGKVEKTLGKRDLAFESFTRMLELDDIDELRDARFGSATEIIDLLLTGEKVDYAEAIKIGEPLQRSLRPNEQRTQIAQDLRVALARAFLAQSKDEANVKPNERKRALSDARKLLIAAKKVSGTHDEITAKLLAEVGIDADSSEEVATMPTADDPKSFADALASARIIFQTVQDLTEQVQSLTEQGGNDDEIKSLEESLSSARQTGIVILRRGLSMVHSDTEAVQINEGRQFLAFLLLQEKYFRDSFVVGNFLAQFAPGTEVGLSGGIIALNSAQQIISAEGTGNEYWVNRVKELGDYLVEKWPNDPKAASAKGVAIIMALDQNDLVEAKRMIDAIPPGIEQAKFQRVLGQFYWNDSLKLRQDKQDAEAAKMNEAAASELTKGLEQIQGGDVGEDTMQAALILAKIRLRQDNPNEAVKVMDHPQYGPITLIKTLDTPKADMLFDLYRTELQAVVGQMTSATGDQEKLLARASQSIDKMQENAKDEAGQKRLIDTFRGLAFDIQEQIKNAPLARQKQLIDAFNVFLSRISSIAKDDTTLLWVGQTMLGMAESAIPEGQVKADGQAAELLKTAISTFETLKQKPNPSDSIPFMLGKSLRLQGEYSAALKEFRAILTAKPTMIDAQEEAALTYEQWAAVLPAAYKAEAYRSALSGDKQKIIWGWGKISTMTQQSPAFRERFFVARYHVALCRFQQGQAANDAKITAQAERDITGLVGLYPDMGGPEQFRQFDSLLKKIQIAIGKNPSGLPEPPAPAPANANAKAPR